MAKPDHVLIVEDDNKTASLISLYLHREGFETSTAFDGVEALELFRQDNPAIVILDLMLPRLDGWEVCRRIREISNVPIVMLTARGEEFDRVLGLTIGADDYVVKPFSPRELVARIRAVLRRTTAAARDISSRLKVGGLILDIHKHEAAVENRRIVLTPSEFKLLRLLMNAPGRLFTREQLLDALYPLGEQVIDRVVDVHIGKLRQKVEQDPANPRYILTVRGFGYLLARGDQEDIPS
ncbi:DNA-binding response regulator in two-component regulatory system with BaeS [Syntrophobacter sp. SbD1]|nr:DNA-binding response regulator in two-component regulatory system with BaeS [Syntrophobacter sp. SbD1]